MQPGILDERARLYLPAGTAERERPHENAEFRPCFQQFYFYL